MAPLVELRLPLRPFVQVLSNVVDLVGVDDHAHARRVAYLAVQLARALGFEPSREQRLYEAALLHDCGVSSTREDRRIMDGGAWAQAHCRLGSQRLLAFPPLAHLSGIVLHHRTTWSVLAAHKLPQDTALDANLIFLANRVDAVSRPLQSDELFANVDRIRDAVIGFGPDTFEPSLLNTFLDRAGSESFWIPLSIPAAVFALQSEFSAEPAERFLDWPRFKQGASLIADVFGAKSRLFREHSLGVARLSRFLARQAGLGEPDCERIEVAGLLHDLGKLHIPDEILDAPRALSDGEWEQMRAHSNLTYEILKPLKEIETLAYWAARHHERPNGTGYPFHDREVSLPVRILAVADVYQALAQERPYHRALAPGEVLRILEDLAASCAVDRAIVEIVRSQLSACHREAVGTGGTECRTSREEIAT